MSHDHELCSKIWSPYFVFQMLDSQTEYNTFIFTSKEACLELSIQPKAVANTLRDSRWLLDRTDDTGIEKPQKKKKKNPYGGEENWATDYILYFRHPQAKWQPWTQDASQ